MANTTALVSDVFIAIYYGSFLYDAMMSVNARNLKPGYNAAEARMNKDFLKHLQKRLDDHPNIASSARNALDLYGYGRLSVRFICGTQDVHQTLE